MFHRNLFPLLHAFYVQFFVCISDNRPVLCQAFVFVEGRLVVHRGRCENSVSRDGGICLAEAFDPNNHS